jgi:hypothetical protein
VGVEAERAAFGVSLEVPAVRAINSDYLRFFVWLFYSRHG